MKGAFLSTQWIRTIAREQANKMRLTTCARWADLQRTLGETAPAQLCRSKTWEWRSDGITGRPSSAFIATTLIAAQRPWLRRREQNAADQNQQRVTHYRYRSIIISVHLFHGTVCPPKTKGSPLNDTGLVISVHAVLSRLVTEINSLNEREIPMNPVKFIYWLYWMIMRIHNYCIK